MTDINRMREQFEAALVAMHVATGMPECNARLFLEVSSNGYTSVYTKAAWWAWQASREAVSVELPTMQCLRVNQYDYQEARQQCVEAIEAQGLKVAP